MLIPFRLVPYRPSKLINPIEGHLDFLDDVISYRYTLSADWRHIRWPEQSASPTRVRGLWEATCFEFFLGRSGASDYQEINLSPSGDWNSFKFSRTRTDMAASFIVPKDLPKVTTEAHSRHLSGSLIHTLGSGIYQIGVSAVIHDTAGRAHYFAASHPLEGPDFHDRSFWPFLVQID